MCNLYTYATITTREYEKKKLCVNVRNTILAHEITIFFETDALL